MGPTALLPLRREDCWGFFRLKNSDAFGRVRTRELGYQRPARYLYTTEAALLFVCICALWRWLQVIAEICRNDFLFMYNYNLSVINLFLCISYMDPFLATVSQACRTVLFTSRLERNIQFYMTGYSPVEMWWHTVTHGRRSEGDTGEWSG
jgi:hypothetical protein